MEPERCPLLAKARLISDTRDALSALLTDPKAPPAPDAAAAHAAVLRIVPPCLQDRVAAALHSSYGDDIDPSDTDTGETALARHVLAALQSLPRVDVDLHVQDEVPPAFFYSVHYSPAGPTPLRLQRLEGAFRSVVSGSVLNEELYRELEGFMYPRGARERPWYLGGHASAGRLLI